ncbi:AI-2E family transporter [Candidatus Saccharibacteria bacterium]|nr:AI-2E family transporter [Candidatus Saccharibacteria bacterium]MBI3337992.1 AI-2E family transporter [Candidatus Saccharibacteria bacterium]
MSFWLRSKNKEPGVVEVTLSNRTIIRVFLLAIMFIIFWSAFQEASHALLLIFTAFFLALALNAPVHWLAERLPGKRRGNRTTATALSFFVVLALLIGFIASILPPLVRQTSSFIDVAPTLVDDVRDENTSLGRFVRHYKLEDQVEKFSSQLSDRLDNLSGTAVSTFNRVTSSIFSTLTILVLTFMMLIEGPAWMALLKRLVPDENMVRVDNLGNEMYRVVKGYVNGQVLLAAIASVMILVPLLILNVSYPVALMVIVFVCGLIPLVGHTIGALIVSSVALFHSVPAAIIILAYYILYQQIENYIIQPKVQSNSTNMSPLLVFSSVIVGVSFGGLFGGLVAIPIAGCVRIIVLDYLNSHKLLSKAEVNESIKTVD